MNESDRQCTILLALGESYLGGRGDRGPHFCRRRGSANVTRGDLASDRADHNVTQGPEEVRRTIRGTKQPKASPQVQQPQGLGVATAASPTTFCIRSQSASPSPEAVDGRASVEQSGEDRLALLPRSSGAVLGLALRRQRLLARDALSGLLRHLADGRAGPLGVGEIPPSADESPRPVHPRAPPARQGAALGPPMSVIGL